MAMSAPMLTAPEAAARMKVAVRTVRALAAGGLLPAVKVGKGWRFDETLLAQWIERRSMENVRRCQSDDVKIRRISRSGSSSLAGRLDTLLGQQTEPPPKSSSRSFAVVTGGRSS
jgi:excisionase family DNA binding protein